VHSRIGSRSLGRGVRRKLRLLEIYAVFSSLVLGLLSVAAFSHGIESARFTELTVERLNIVEADGKPRLVISNTARAPGWVFQGVAVPGRPKNAGLIFFNDEGDEDGGLIYGSNPVAGGGYSAGASLTFDQYHQDQVVALQYNDENGQRRMGLAVNDEPTTYTLAQTAVRQNAIRSMSPGRARDAAQRSLDSLTASDPPVNRAYFGRARDGSAVLRLADRQGHPRIRMIVDSVGEARLEFLDASGHVTTTLPSAR